MKPDAKRTPVATASAQISPQEGAINSKATTDQRCVLACSPPCPWRSCPVPVVDALDVIFRAVALQGVEPAWSAS